MNKVAIAKTMLNIYSNLENVCKKIDDEVNLSTRVLSETNNAYFGTMLTIFDNISEIIYRKGKLVNLKIYLEQALYKLSSEYASILYLKYMDKFSIKQISEVINCPLKATERKIIVATKLFAENLAKVGLTDEIFENTLKTESWIKKIYLYFCGVKKEPEPCCCQIKIINGLITKNSINALTKREYRCF